MPPHTLHTVLFQHASFLSYARAVGRQCCRQRSTDSPHPCTAAVQVCSSCLASSFATWLHQGPQAGGSSPLEVLAAQGLEQRALSQGLPLPGAWLPQVARQVSQLATVGLGAGGRGQ
jgi:hypothetical protein